MSQPQPQQDTPIFVNGHKVMPIVNSDTPLPGRPKPGPWVTEPNCVQPPPQSVKDHATFTLSEQKLYGIPPREPGESFDHWAKFVRSLTTRACQYRDMGIVHGGLSQQFLRHPLDINNAGNAALGIWAGNIADEPCSGCTPQQEVLNSDANSTYTYTEIDSDWYIPCLVSGQYGYQGSSAWVGIGGSSNNDELVQAGSESDFLFDGQQYWTIHYVWWEYWSGNPNNPRITTQQLSWNIGCGSGAHIWVRINGNNCYTIEWLNNGGWFYQCTGPSYSTHTAEAVVEIQQGAPADYGTVKFQGVGIRENTLGYQGFPNLWHDYSHMTDSNGQQMAHTDPIVYDGSDAPYDDFNIDWKAYM